MTRHRRRLTARFWTKPCTGCDIPKDHTHHLTRYGRFYFNPRNVFLWGRR